ncbi:hypothetical protein AVEN_95359-1 [Araneus ventricosus]|uniref:Uncharacterized protein n=1 Tax=Araneus ventricosus TaxID=182803 RepID=A0A4Y2QNT0_ARAVE|nr:hypothetical protein AVEN_95359-1 [Araneus ventricosus]
MTRTTWRRHLLQTSRITPAGERPFHVEHFTCATSPYSLGESSVELQAPGNHSASGNRDLTTRLLPAEFRITYRGHASVEYLSTK